MSQPKEGEITKKIPPPAPNHRRKYRYDELEIGESVWYAVAITYSAALLSYVKRKYPNRRFTSRTENGGTRTWRIEDADK